MPAIVAACGPLAVRWGDFPAGQSLACRAFVALLPKNMGRHWQIRVVVLLNS